MAEVVAALGPALTTVIGAGATLYHDYQANKDTGNGTNQGGVKKKKCKKWCCCCLSFLLRRRRRQQREAEEPEVAAAVEDGEVHQDAVLSMRGGDDQDGINYDAGTRFMPVFVCCGGVLKNEQHDEGAYISDGHTNVNKSQRVLQNEQFSHVGRSNSDSKTSKHLRRVNSSPGRQNYRTTTDV